ncbi:hypothetical protein QFC19_006880 [Naganishia cerealis]|uniref:Uncharacterized protein n=1 Tax=Naganishia cerealis TaxID=610337 RepID=A0ACC2VCJ5_9TREE|nr:hypothetical protein QFC19_006880 [Naganishia cerealis]
MDSRQLFLSKKDSSNGRQSQSRPKNVLSLVKRIFSWGTHPDGSRMSDNSAQDLQQTRGNESYISARTPMNEAKVGDAKQTPSQVLSKFFSEKGDKPLTDIEYEGVQSLLAKARDNDTFLGDSSVLEGKNKRRRGLAQAPDVTNRSLLANLTGNGSFFYSTPQKQTLLRNPNASQIITPDYRPTYHSVNPRSIRSVKRVYHFSGVPSPYRTRITAPMRSAKAKQVLQDEKLHPPAALPSTTFDFTSKPMSATAGTLLSIIDGSETKDQVASKEDNKAGKFSNPYSSAGSIKAKKSEPTQTTLTKSKFPPISAKDIVNTTSFDKSEPIENTPSGEKTQPEKTQPNLSFAKTKATEKSAPLSSTICTDSGQASSLTETAPAFGQFGGSVKANSSSFKSSAADSSVGHIDMNSQALAPQKPRAKPFSAESKAKYDYTFPGVDLKVADLDSAKVESFKSGFIF